MLRSKLLPVHLGGALALEVQLETAGSRPGCAQAPRRPRTISSVNAASRRVIREPRSRGSAAS